MISDERVNDLLLKLKEFEESNKFLQKDISITSLANSFNTNSRYLSEVINQYKEKNFHKYISSLRIQYITNVLYENPIYRKYKTTHLAEICGFSSREIFSAIFKKETGMTPSFFINQLKK